MQQTLDNQPFDPQDKEQVNQTIQETQLSTWDSVVGTGYFFYYLTLGYFFNPEKHKAVKEMWGNSE